MTAREIEEDFINTMNPSRWAGVGYNLKPSDFHDDVWKTYNIDNHPEIDIDIHFEYDGNDDGYWYICEAVDKDTDEKIGEGIWGSDVNSIDGLEIAIREVFMRLNIDI